MKMTIESAANGAVLTAHADPGDEVLSDRKYVYEFDEEDEDKSMAGLVNMLYDIMEIQGWNMNTKYGRERVSISMKHGNDYECKETECLLCQAGK